MQLPGTRARLVLLRDYGNQGLWQVYLLSTGCSFCAPWLIKHFESLGVKIPVLSWLLLPVLMLTSGSCNVLVLFLPSQEIACATANATSITCPPSVLDLKMWRMCKEEIKIPSTVQKFCH